MVLDDLYFKMCNYSSIILNSDEGKVVGGWLGKQIDKGWDATKKAVCDAVVDLLQTAFDYIGVFVNWGCKLAIVGCIVIFFCTKQKETATTGLKAFLIFLLFNIIKMGIDML